MCVTDTEMHICFGKGKIKVCAVVRVEAESLQVSFVSKGVHLTVWKRSTRITLLV